MTIEETITDKTGIENNDNDNNDVKKETEVDKVYTKEEAMALAQSIADKRVTQALDTQKKKYEKDLSLSKMDENQRAVAEKENRIAELEEMVAQMNTEKNKSELKSVLSSRGLSAEFADIVIISEDLEQSQNNIDKLDKLFKEAVKAEVEKRLSGTAPKGNGTAANIMNKEAFDKLSIAEQSKLLKSNPEFYNQFLGGNA